MNELVEPEGDSEDEMVRSEVESEIEELEMIPSLLMNRRRRRHRHGNWLPLRCYFGGLWVV